MDALSFEIISLIRDNLGRFEYLARYSTISRRWQAVVETRTFANVFVHDLGNFQALFSSPYRRAALRGIDLSVDMPVYGWSRVHQRQKHLAFLYAITSLLDLLNAWDQELRNDVRSGATSLGPIKLQVSACHGLDPKKSQDDYNNKILNLDTWGRTEAWKRYFEFDKEDVGSMVKVPYVSQLDILSDVGENNYFHQVIYVRR
ncbi:hypothetical protein PG996_006762 [Apiospora saccharicola]|uniref:F-box domain-containing protein n=1 Tax=Apiospora saccharicola TaxID=335842 RepID=A0ABR1V8X3_9PEZI